MRLGVRGRFVIAITAVLVVFVTLSFGVSYRLMKAAATQLVQTKHEAQLKRYLQEIDSFTDVQSGKAESLAYAGEWVHALERHNPQVDSAEAAMAVAIAQVRAASDDALLGCGLWYEPYALEEDRRWVGPYAVVDGPGKARPNWEYSNDEYNYITHGWYTIALPESWERDHPRPRSLYMTEPYLDSLEGRPTVFVSFTHLMYSEHGRIIGVATADWTFDSLAQELEGFRVTENSFAFLVHGPSRKVLFPAERDELDLLHETEWGAQIDTANLSVGQISRAGGISIGPRGYDVIYTRTRAGFVFGLMLDHEEAYAFLDDIATQNLMIALATVLIIGLAAFWVVSRLLRPVRDLARSAQIISEGDLDHRSEISSRDEIGDLARAFNEATDRLRGSEAQLRQAQKLEAVGRLAGGVAHDFNNAMTAVLGHTDLLLLRHGDDPNVAPQLEDIRRAGEHAVALTRQLLTFSKKHVGEPAFVDVNRIVIGIERMLSRIIGEDVELETRTEPDLPPVHVDPSRLEQVLVNLAVNARDAMPGGGRLVVETRLEKLEARTGSVIGPAEPGSYIAIDVSDTGVGIPDEVLDKIFDPFFTTKGLDAGTGLGLSTVYGIVKDMEGHVFVESTEGRGSRFSVLLPPREGAVDEKAVGGGELELGLGEKILVVEDERMVRETTVMILRTAGFMVYEASAGAEALRLLEAEDGIALVVTDVVMPQMSGAELATATEDLRPGLPVLFVSGYCAGELSEEIARAPGRAFLQKPFDPRELVRAVRNLLDESGLGRGGEKTLH